MILPTTTRDRPTGEEEEPTQKSAPSFHWKKEKLGEKKKKQPPTTKIHRIVKSGKLFFFKKIELIPDLEFSAFVGRKMFGG